MIAYTHATIRRARAGLLAGWLSLGLFAATAPGQVLLSEPPAAMAAADIVERRGEEIALNATFTDQTGRAVRISDLFDGKRPVVFVLAYFTCPVVCPVVLNNTQRAFNELAWTLGKEYRAVTVSFDHRDTPDAAKSQQSAYLSGIDRSTGEEAWPFLTGSAEQIRLLCDSLGWKYQFIPQTGDFSHPTAIIVASPDGKVSNYLYGVKYEARQLRLSLVDASEGKVGSVFDRILLRCYHYDPNEGSYVLAAQRVMTAAGLLTVMLLTGVIAALVQFDRSRTRRARLAATEESDVTRTPMSDGSDA